jgi:hypothetical protein
MSLTSLPASAQVNPEMAEFTTDIEAMRSLVQTERKLLIMGEMLLTADEANEFWPLYDDYAAERKKLGNLKVKLVTDYAASYDSMTDEIARELLDLSFSYESKLLSLKKKHLRKFRRILSDIQVTRYFQLESKLDAVINFDMAAQIPLME